MRLHAILAILVAGAAALALAQAANYKPLPPDVVIYRGVDWDQGVELAPFMTDDGTLLYVALPNQRVR